MKLKKLFSAFISLVMLVTCTGICAAAEEEDTYVVIIEGTYHYRLAVECLEFVNAERAEAGLEPLVIDEQLTAAAMQRAAECSVDFGHERPNGESCYTLDAKMNGENIAGGSSTAEGTYNQWFNSAGHHANYLSASYKSVGVGCFQMGKYYYWAEVFSYQEADVTPDRPDSVDGTATVEILEGLQDIGFNLRQTDDPVICVGDTKALVPGRENPGWDYAYAIIPASNFNWRSSDTSIATVDEQGIVTAVSVGDAVITAELKGSNEIISYEVNIRKDVADLELGTIDSAVYNGSEYKPAPVLHDGDKLLAEGTDYTLSYPASPVNAGNYNVTVTGMGNYSGSVNLPYTIDKCPVDPEILTFDLLDSYDYGDKYNASGELYTSAYDYIEDNTTLYYDGVQLARNQYYCNYNSKSGTNVKKFSFSFKGNYSGSVTFVNTFSYYVPDIPDQFCTGEPVEPEIRVYRSKSDYNNGEPSLVRDEDFTCEFENNTENGTANVTITVKGLYFGRLYKTFNISGTDISPVEISLSDTTFVYDGTEKIPEVTVTMDGSVLTEGEDYVLSIADNIEPGTATVTVTGIEPYYGKATAEFEIVKLDISNAEVTLDKTSFVYDGEEKLPEITVTYEGETLTEGVDYTVGFADNTEPGTATVTVTGIGSYEGEVQKTFEIVLLDITNADIGLSENAFVFDGTEKRPDVTVTFDGEELTEDEDYTLTYSDNTEAGTAKVTVTGIGSFTGTVEEEFEITLLDITAADVVLDETEFVYDATEKTPGVTVTIDGNELIKDVDYTVSYSNNKAAGKATVTITGINSYTGELTREFTITSISLEGAELILEERVFIYNGTAIIPNVTVKLGENVLTEGEDYSVSCSGNTEAGTAVLTVTGINGYSGVLSAEFTIEPLDISGGTLTLIAESLAFTGSEVTPDVSIQVGGKTLTKDVDYTVTYYDNIGIGNGRVVAEGIGSCLGRLEQTFSIEIGDITAAEVVLGATEFSYSGAAKAPSVAVYLNGVKLVKNTDYTVAYLDNINAGTARAVITGIGKYQGTIEKTYVIKGRSMSKTTVTLGAASFNYTGAAKAPSVAVKYGSTTLKKNTDYKVVYSDNVNAGTAKVTITGMGNYSGVIIKTYPIVPRDLTKCTVTLGATSFNFSGAAKAPSVAVKYGSATLKKNTDYTVVYSDNVNAGTATVTITGIGNYAGVLTRNYTIVARDFNKCTVTLGASSFNYSGAAKAPSVAVKYGSAALKKNVDYTVVYSDNVNAGTATVTITGIGNYSGVITKNYTIVGRDISKATVTLGAASFTYNGKAKCPSVSIKYGSTTLKKNVDYTVVYSDNVEVGTGKVTITGIGNYYGENIAEFAINPRA